MKIFTKLMILIVAFAIFLSCSACPNKPGSGVTIPQSDSTVPEITLRAGQQGGQDITIGPTESAKSLNLVSKSGALNLVVTAKDSESGIQSLQIWIRVETTLCDANRCTTSSPPVTQPRFESTEPRLQPGQTAAPLSISIQDLNLSNEIPQTITPPNISLKVFLFINVVAVNQLGGQIISPMMLAAWRESSGASPTLCVRAGSLPTTTLPDQLIAAGQSAGRRRIAYYLQNPPDTLLIIVDDAPGLARNQMLLELDIDPVGVNSGSPGVKWEKAIEAWGACHTGMVGFVNASMLSGINVGTACKDLDVSNDFRSGCTVTRTMPLNSSTTRELWLRKGGVLGVWTDAEVIDQSIWDAFGGRSVRFIWRVD